MTSEACHAMEVRSDKHPKLVISKPHCGQLVGTNLTSWQLVATMDAHKLAAM